MFCALQNSDYSNTMNLNEVRLQYGLLNMEWDHNIIKHEQNIEKKKISSEKQSSDEGDWELDGENNKEDTEVFELQENSERKADGNFSFELVKRGIKRKRQDDEHEEEEDNDEDNMISFGALVGESEEDTEEHFIIENMATEEELDDAELLRQLRGDDEEEGENGQSPDTKREELEDKFKSENNDENSDNYNLQEEELEQNDDSEECVSGEKSAQVNKIDSSSRVRKKRRGRQPKYDISAKHVQDEAESDDDTNDNTQTSYKYECSICQKKYKNPTSYRKHIMEKHDKEPDIPDFKCETCNKIYPTERQLQIHARTHLALEDKLDIPCPYCDRKFTKVSVMRQHVQGIHENKKPYICDECGRSLKTLAALAEHKLVHTNDTPFECEVCQRAFKNKARLKVIIFIIFVW